MALWLGQSPTIFRRVSVSIESLCALGTVFGLALSSSLILFGLTAWALLGWGSLITRLFRMRLPAAEQNFSQLWLGVVLTLLVLQLINYFAPINWIVTTLLIVGGLVGWWLNGHKLPSLPATSIGRVQTLLYLLAIALSACWIAMQSMQPVTLYDSGLYHLQTIRWFNEHAIAPGLGNLQGQLAYNQASLAFVAALNVYPFFNLGYALANGFLILLLAAEGWHALIFGRGQRSLAHFATLCMLPIAGYMTLRLNPASPSPVTASTILQLVIWLHFARALEQRATIYEAVTRVHILLLLGATAITVHLSNLVFVAAIALIAIVHTWLVERHPLFIKFIILFRLTWLAMLILVVWMGRGYFLSGYVAYPATIGAFNIDWAVPRYAVEAEAATLVHLAQVGRGAEAQTGWSWMGAWLGRLTTVDGFAAILYPFTLTLLLLIAHSALRLALNRGRIQRVQQVTTADDMPPPPYRLVILPILLALIFWWLTLPDPALVYALFWLLPVILAHALLGVLAGVGWTRPRLNQAIAFLIINLAIIIVFVMDWPQAITLLPGFSPLPKPDVIEQLLSRRVSVWTPVNDKLCWNTQLPCTTHINPQLRQRGSDIQHGFQLVSPFRDSLARIRAVGHGWLVESSPGD